MSDKDKKEMTREEKKVRAMQIANTKFDEITTKERIALMQEMIGIVSGSILIVQLDDADATHTSMVVMNNSSNVALRVGAAKGLMNAIAKELSEQMPEDMVQRIMNKIIDEHDVGDGESIRELLGNTDNVQDLLDDDRFSSLPKPSGRFKDL